MNKGLVFFLGMITGCVLTIAALFYVEKVNDSKDASGLVLYEQPAGVIDSYSFQVMQVLSDGPHLQFQKILVGEKVIQVLLFFSFLMGMDIIMMNK